MFNVTRILQVQVVNPNRLSDAEFDKLADLLLRFGDKRAMNLEAVDGFFAALICGPENVPPSEYLPEIWGGNMVNEPAFQTKPILQEFLSLLTQHWNATCATLHAGDVFLPLLQVPVVRGELGKVQGLGL